jgi:L-malate glycosyltransferase
MVTGAYFPELSGGGLQARGVVQALRDRVDFAVLTTSADRALPRRAEENGVSIRRVYVDIGSATSKMAAALRFAAAFIQTARRVDVVNLHGFSKKAVLLVALTRLFRKPFILTLQTGGHDEPETVRALGPLPYWAYTSADLYLSVSPALSQAYLAAGLPSPRLRQLCNAVDVARFRPADAADRAAIRRELDLPLDLPLVLFVGFFSREKRPDLLFDAWAEVSEIPSALVFVGATRSTYPEIDATLAPSIRERAAARGLSDRIVFVESSHTIERYFRAGDIYALPSVREGLPIALLEAMSTGLACIASRLPGSTDALIEDGANGLLVEADDRAALARALRRLLEDRVAAGCLGAAARRTIEDRYAIDKTAPAWLDAYLEVVSQR